MKITSINTIEVSSVCDNKCPYCPAPIQSKYREVGLMDMETYRQAIKWVKYFSDKGTQRELNLHGVGEPTLNFHLVRMIREVREVMKGPINFNTNGNTITYELAKSCKEAGVTSINVTAHNAQSTKKAVQAIRRAGVKCDVSVDFSVTPNNWAGQVDWTDSVDYKLFCFWLAYGHVMVLSDGSITRCCLDAFKKGVIGTVFEDITKFELTKFSLCNTCHHTIT